MTLWKSRAERILRTIVVAEKAVALLLVMVILGVMAAQVIARYFFQHPLSWSEEVARLAMIWLTFIAASFVLAERQHVAVELPGFGMLLNRRQIAAVILVASLLMLLGGLPFVLSVYPVGSPSTGISKSYWYGAAIVGLGLMSLHAAAEIAGLQVRDHKAEQTDHSHSSWEA